MYLAKPNETIEEHTKKVEHMVNAFNHIDETIRKKARISAIFHDIGKTNDDFQNAIKKNSNDTGVRHEIYSYYIYRTLSELGYIDYDPIVSLSILTHHKLLLELKNHIDYYTYIIKTKLNMNDEFFECLKSVTGINVNNVDEFRNTYVDLVDTLNFEIIKDEYKSIDQTIFILTKGVLQQADHLASAFPYNPPTIRTHIRNNINIQPYEFQRRVQQSNADIVIINAGTGSGKTEAALLGSGNPTRIIYTLNTKSSISAMVERLKQIYGDNNVSYLYSSLIYSLLESLLNDMDQIDSAEHFQIYNFAKTLKTLYQYTVHPIKVTTPYQVFKTICTNKSYAIRMIDIYNSTLIYDEVHILYENDDNVYTNILNTLKLPLKRVIMMSATIPTKLIEEVQNIANEHNKTIDIINAYDEFNPIRHNYEFLEGEITELDIMEHNGHIYVNGKEVKTPLLIITNTVKRAIEVYKNAKVKRKILLHSKFKHKDKKKREQAIINNIENYDLIVTTQLVETSVDISAKTLITEKSPIPSLIQRAGRVNRRYPYEYPNNPNIYIMTELRSHLPYYRKMMNITEKLINDIIGIKDARIEAKLSELYYDSLGNKIFKKNKVWNLELIKRKCNKFDTIKVVTRKDYEKITNRKNEKEQLFELVRNIITIDHVNPKMLTYMGLGIYIIDAEYDEEYGLILNTKN